MAVKSTALLILLANFLAVANAWFCDCGFYCPDPVKKFRAPILCPVGDYCTKSLFNRTSFPTTCPAGKQCPTPGLCAPVDCPCGTYCPAGSSQPIPCPVDHFCQVDTIVPSTCPTGTCPNQGMCSPQCPNLSCDPLNPPPGFVCLNDYPSCGLICIDDSICGTTPPVNVPTTPVNKPPHTTPPPVFVCGFYGTEQLSCPAGFYCPSGATPSTPIQKVKCPAGSSCGPGVCAPTPCPCGFKCPAGSSAPTECQPPFYCPNTSSVTMTLCPIGFKCDVPGMCQPTPCPPGTFVTCAGKKSCDACAAGRYCPTPTSSVLCPAGSFCPEGSSAPALCPALSYCPLGSAQPLACPPGTTSDAGARKRSQCTPAP